MAADFMFPITIDSSMLSAFRSCPQKFFREYFEHWKPKGNSIHLHAGAAYASGLEAARRAFFVDGKPEAEAERIGADVLAEHYGDFVCPSSCYKTVDRMLGALDFYFSKYPMATDHAKPAVIGDQHGIEFAFQQPLPIPHPETGDPLIFSGRADTIVQFAGGIYIEDDKTTSRLGDSWRNQWEMRGQFTGYCWAAQQMGIKTSGVLVRGVSILKNGFDTAEVPTYRSQMEIDRWYYQTMRDIGRMLDMYHHYKQALVVGQQDPHWVWSHNLDEACNSYGGCPFQSACKSKEPDSWISSTFEQVVWDPGERDLVPLAEYKAKWLNPSKDA